MIVQKREKLKREADAAYQKKKYYEAIALYKQAALLGSVEAQFALAKMYLEENSKGYNNPKCGLEWLQKAADNGHLEAAAYLKKLQGGKSETKTKTVVGQFETDVYSNAIFSQYYTAETTQSSTSQKSNRGQSPVASPQSSTRKAMPSKTERTSEERMQAVNSLEELYQQGLEYYEGKNGKAKNSTEALCFWRISAKQGHVKSMAQAGHLLYWGDGVVRDNDEAMKWWFLAAEQGQAGAQCNIGSHYSLKWDYTEAVKWWRLAAEQGHMYAQECLGRCYELGNGVEKDYSMAKYWYKKSAAQGNEDALESYNNLEKSTN